MSSLTQGEFNCYDMKSQNPAFGTKLFLLFAWLLPILISASTGRLEISGNDWLVPYMQIVVIGAGFVFIVLSFSNVAFNVNVLLVLVLLFGLVLYSDIREYKYVSMLLMYSIYTHLMAKRYPNLVWRQYHFVAAVVSVLSLIDFFYYWVTGGFIVSYRSVEIVGGIFPRVNTVFDEMSHQAFFLFPALILSIRNRSGSSFLFLCGFLLTFSVSAYLLFLPMLFVYGELLRGRSTNNLMYTLILSIGIIVMALISYDFIISKISHILNPALVANQTKVVSAANILLGFELIRSMHIYDMLFGYGYFGYQSSVSSFLNDSNLYHYYYSIGLIDDPKSVGVVNFILYFGIIVVAIVTRLIYIAGRNASDKMIYSISLITVVLSMTKNSHTIGYLVHLFFIFSLAWTNAYCEKEKNASYLIDWVDFKK
jgi:hypothetical protein